MSWQFEKSVNSWPVADQTFWKEMTQAANLFDVRGALSHLRPATIEMMMRGYGRWLAWINRFCPDVMFCSPPDRATHERMKAWLDSLNMLAPSSRLMYFGNALRTLMGAYPRTNWDKHKRLLTYLEREAKEYVSLRKNGRIVSSDVLFQAGLKLASGDADAARTEIARMKHRRDGCLLAFLSAIPLRCRAMSELRLGKSLLVGKSSITIYLDAGMTKTGMEWEATIPDPLKPVLQQYLFDVRPWLMERGSQDHEHVWVTDKGRPLNKEYLAAKTRRVSLRLLGVMLSPHLFRDAAATTLARKSPIDARLIRSLLGHSGHQTAERYYNHAAGLDATRSYADIVNSVRKGT